MNDVITPMKVTATVIVAILCASCESKQCGELRGWLTERCGVSEAYLDQYLEGLERQRASCAEEQATHETTWSHAVRLGSLVEGAGTEAFCASFDDLESMSAFWGPTEAVQWYRLTGVEDLVRSAVEEALRVGDLERAEQIAEVVEQGGATSVLRTIRVFIGRARLSPQYTVEAPSDPDGFLRRSFINKRIMTGGGCASGSFDWWFLRQVDYATLSEEFERFQTPGAALEAAILDLDMVRVDEIADRNSHHDQIDRAYLLATLGRTDEARQTLEHILTLPDLPEGGLSRSLTQILLARLLEDAGEFTSAREHYREAGGDAAWGRVDALEGLADGAPLPRFRVHGWVNLPPNTQLERVVLTASPEQTQSSGGAPPTHSNNLLPREATYTIEAQVEGHDWEAQAAPGAWTLGVVVSGEDAYTSPDRCWPMVVVAGADVEVVPLDVIVDPDEN